MMTTIRLSIILIFSFLNLFSFGQNEKSFSESERISDLDYLQEALYSSHQSIFRYRAKPEMDSFFDILKSKKGDLSQKDFFYDLKRLLGKIGCIHTSIQYPKIKKKDKKQLVIGRYYLPYSIYKDGNQYWTKTSRSDTISQYGWKQILSIDGNRLDTIGAMEEIWPNDGYSKAFGQELINHFGNLNSFYEKKYKIDSLVNYVFLQKGDTISITLPAIQKKDLLRTKKQKTTWLYSQKKHAFRYDSINDLGILKISSFSYNMVKTPLFYHKVFKFLRKNEVKNLVIDLRNNGGGSMGDAHLVLSYLIAEKAKYFLYKKENDIWNHATLKSKFNLFMIGLKRDVFSLKRRYRQDDSKIYVNKIRRMKKSHFDGNIYVFVNGYTASAASFTGSYIKEKGPAIVFGTETGGGAMGNNGLTYPKIELPNSKFEIRIPQLWIDYNLGQDMGQGVMPDFPVEYHVDDVKNGVDLEMDALLDVLSRR